MGSAISVRPENIPDTSQKKRDKCITDLPHSVTAVNREVSLTAVK